MFSWRHQDGISPNVALYQGSLSTCIFGYYSAWLTLVLSCSNVADGVFCL